MERKRQPLSPGVIARYRSRVPSQGYAPTGSPDLSARLLFLLVRRSLFVTMILNIESSDTEEVKTVTIK